MSPAEAIGGTVALTVAMFALFAPYGWGTVLVVGTFLVLGFAYDLGVALTPFSGVTHGLAFPALPLFAWDLFAR